VTVFGSARIKPDDPHYELALKMGAAIARLGFTVMTGGGPGTATEPIALYTFSALLENLRFGFGSALSVIIFTVTFVLALVAIRLMGRRALLEPMS